MSSRIEKGGALLGDVCLPRRLLTHGAEDIAKRLEQRDILVKPLNDLVLGRGYMRVTTALPEDNQRFVTALEEILGHGEDLPI